MTTRQGLRAQTVQDLLDQLFQIGTEQRDNPLVTSVGTTVAQVLRANPSRIAFVFTNLGVFPVYLWSDAQVSTSRGVRVGENGGTAIAIYDEDFSRVAFPWYAVADGGTSNIAIQEVLIGS